MNDNDKFKGLALKAGTEILDSGGWSLCYHLEIEREESGKGDEWLVMKVNPRYQTEVEAEQKYASFNLATTKVLNLTQQIKELHLGSLPIEHLLQKSLEEKFRETMKFRELCMWFQHHNNFYIDKVSMGDFFSIKQGVKLKLSGCKEVYFLGENGDGKSLVLMGMHLAFNGTHIAKNLASTVAAPAQDMMRFRNGMLLSGTDSNRTSYELGKAYYLNNFYTYGANRAIATSDNPDESGFMSLYSDRCELYHPIKLLSQTYLIETEKKLDSGNMITEEKDLPNWVPLKKLEELFHELLDERVTIQTTWEGVKFVEKGSVVKFEHLSDGFKNILIWVSDLIYRLQKDQPKLGDLSKFRAVVMVDEIELHLHPSWQNDLVKKLRKYFPLVQFIFTTHSPSIIQGASDDAMIFRVYRDSKTGITSVSEPYFKKDMTHMMYNTLVTSPLFGLESARISPETEEPDTSDSFLTSRIAVAVKQRLKEQKAAGKTFLSKEMIDSLIQEVLNESLKK